VIADIVGTILTHSLCYLGGIYTVFIAWVLWPQGKKDAAVVEEPTS